MNTIIATHALGKNYGSLRAVENLSLQVRSGEIYAFLGLNGAGKTTTIRMLLGMIRPTSGYAEVLQTRVRPGESHPWQDVGYMVEIPHSYPELTVLENLEVARRLHPGTPRPAIDRMIERLDLGPYTNRRASQLSHGNAQRLGLAKALLHSPKLLLLDEPANGLDPAGIVDIRNLLLELSREHGVTIFMSSHILAEVARLAQRIGIIHQGRLVQELSVAELEANRRRRLLLQTRHPETARLALSAAGQPVELRANGTLELHSSQAIERPDEINRMLVQAGAAPTRLVVEEEDLEAYFLRLIGLEGMNGHERA